MAIKYSQIQTPIATTHQHVSRYRAPRAFYAAKAVVTAGAAASVSHADVELENPAFKVTALWIVAYATGLVVIG